MANLDQTIKALNALLKDKPELESQAVKSIGDLTTRLSATGKDAHGKPLPIVSGPIEKLKEGFQEFKAYFKKESALFESLAKSQHPKFIIIGCVDSRADPALTLGLGFGEAFTLRNVANLIHPKHSGNISVATALEYSILHLKVEHLLVIGHSKCGGINAILHLNEDGSNKSSDYIEDWVSVTRDAANKAKAKLPKDAPYDLLWEVSAKESVNASIWNALTYPFVKDAVDGGRLELHGAYLDFVAGSFELWTYNYSRTEPQPF